jgi:murein L,D-transpeptidase YcbB/YkuD
MWVAKNALMSVRTASAHPFLFMTFAALGLVGCGGASGERGDARAAKPTPVVEAIKARFAGPAPDYAASDPRAWEQAKNVYAAGGWQAIWTEDGALGEEAEALEAAVARAPEDGLDPAHYDVAAVKALGLRSSGFLQKGSPPERVAEAEARLSFVFLSLARDLQSGRIEPGKVDRHWFGKTREADFVKTLPGAVESGTIGEALSGLVPRHPQYVALKKALARYRAIAAGGGWPAVPARGTPKPGASGPEVAALVTRLAATGDLAAGHAPIFDGAVGEAVKRFQRRHGLDPHGRLDAETLAALNVPVARRIRQIELNLERWRWMPETLGDQHLLVNIPTYHLTAFEGDRPALAMRVVAGKKESPTPIFSDEMQTVVFSPYWNVPPDIAREETIPALMRDPGYLYANNLEVVRDGRVVDPYSVDWSDRAVRIRQRPGPKNSLGHVKFVFPNNFDVYLHDTPADSLFGRVERDYSHGCVRVEKPFELARWVLRHQPEWTPERIQAAMDSGEERHVALETPVPVYLVYATTWVDPDGALRFAEDVYGHDATQDRLLPPSPPPAAPQRVASN